MNKYLIVNADDYGISDGICRRVVEGHLHVIITSTSVMLNTSFAKAAIREAQRIIISEDRGRRG